MKIAVGADHGGYDLKQSVLSALAKHGIDVEDLGCYGKASVDYPDYAAQVASRVTAGKADQGILVCTTGIGMSVAANKFPGIRAAQCLNPEMASRARTHNNANVLVLAGMFTGPDEAGTIVDAWLENSFSAADRHKRRIAKIEDAFRNNAAVIEVLEQDPETHAAIRNEEERQARTLNLIASENHVSRAVREAQGTILTNKYAEGYPGKRWYNGCEHVDTAESLAIGRAVELFGAEHANVQPHCGSSANLAVYMAALDYGDTILAMRLDHGGHLTHGHHLNFSGRFFKAAFYGVNRETEQIDYDELLLQAKAARPKLIVAGASSYPRLIDFKRMREIADGVGAGLMVDMAHIAGLVAGGCHPSPVPHAEFITSTTHKTLRGPRGGMILCRHAYARDIDRQVFPGTQGGPLMHVIASKAVCFREALQPAFKTYAEQIVRNSKTIASDLAGAGFRLVAGGTDNHLLLMDLSSAGLTGKQAAEALEKTGIVVNKNVIPFDRESPFVTSGIRIGTPAVTTRGMKEAEMREIAGLIVDVLRAPQDAAVLKRTAAAVKDPTSRFPAP